MRKFKNFPLVTNSSKLFRDSQYSQIVSKRYKNEQVIIEFPSGKPKQCFIVNSREISYESEPKMNETEDEERNVENSKKRFIMYTPILHQYEISNFSGKIQDYSGFNQNNFSTEWNRFLMRKRDSAACTTALVPWMYNSRALSPYKIRTSYITHPYAEPKIPNKEILKISFSGGNQKFDQDLEENSYKNYVYGNPSKFALSLEKILDETENAQIATSRNDLSFNMSRSCRSCPAVFEIKQFPSQLSPKKIESKVLLLSGRNFEKFDKTFTKLLVKNKIRAVEPLLQNFENRNQVLTKLEKAFVNHDLQQKNNDIIKRNVIVMQPRLMEKMKKQPDLNENPEENLTKDKSTWTKSISNVYNKNMKRAKTPSNIMIINDDIFEAPMEKKVNKNTCNISEKTKHNMIYLNNSIFREINKNKVEKILNRTYASSKNEETKPYVMIPTRHTSKKLKSLRLREKEQKEHEDIQLENLIAAVAEKKQLEYIQRSKMSWKVFKQFEETMEKAKILNFPTQEALEEHYEFKSEEQRVESVSTNCNKSINNRKRKRSITRKKEKNFDQEFIPPELSIEVKIKPTPYKVKSKNKTKMKEKSPNTNDIKKGITELKEMTSYSKIKADMKTYKQKKVETPNVKINISKSGKSVKKKDGDTSPLSNKYTENKETKKSSLPRVMKSKVSHTNNKKEKISNSSESKSITNMKIPITYEKVTLKNTMANKQWIENSSPKKGKEQFINIKSGRHISFEKQKSWSLKEREEPSIEIIHKNNMKSPLSSSQSDLIGDLIEKPKKKIKKQLDDNSKKKIDSTDLEDETETKLVVEELLASSHPLKKQKKVKYPSEKVKSKIPILGTPTSITKQIEKVVATALATCQIREKLNREDIPEEVINEECKNKRRAKVIKIKPVESRKEFLGNESKDNNMIDGMKNEKTKENMSEIKVDTEKIEEDNRLPIDEILALNSNLILDKINRKIAKKNEMKTKKETNEFPNGHKKEQMKNSLSTEIDHKNLKEYNGLKEKTNSQTDMNVGNSSDPNFENFQNNKSKGKIETEENISNANKNLTLITKKKSLGSKMSNSADKLQQIGKTQQEKGIFKNSYDLDKIDEDTTKRSNKDSKLIKTEENLVEKRDALKEPSNVKKEGTKITEYSPLETEKFFHEKKMKMNKNVKKTKNTSDTSQMKITLVSDSNYKESFGIEKMPTEESKPSSANNEIIRERRLIYFGKKIKKKSESESVKNKEIFGLNPNTKREFEKDKIKEKENHESFIATSSITNPIMKINNIHEDNSIMKQEKKSSFAQYDIKSSTKVLEKSIETEIIDKDAAVADKNESELCEAKTTTNHKILKKSISDNVITIRASRKDSKEAVESTQGITKSFLKQIQDKMNFIMDNSKSQLKHHAMKKCKEITIKLKNSQEKIARTIPASINKFYQEAKKLKNKVSASKIIRKTSREIINKFTNTNVKLTTDNCSQAELNESKKLSPKSQNRVNSVIERKVTNKIKLLKRTPVTKTRTHKKNMNKSKMRDENVSLIKKARVDSPPSLSDIQNRSIGSLFADTVASALAKCGDVERIMSKYSDSTDIVPISKIEETNKNEDFENWKPTNGDEKKVIIKKEDEFLMSDGVRKLVLHVTLEKKEENVNGEEWKCSSRAVLVKKSNEDVDKGISIKKTTDENQMLKSAEDVTFNDKPNVSCTIADDFNSSQCTSMKTPEQPQKSDKFEENSNTNLDDLEEIDALQETKENLINLKNFILKEREKNTKNDSYNTIKQKDVEIFKNNETFKMKIDEVYAPKSLEDLHIELISDRRTIRTAEGSISPSPLLIEEISTTQEMISNKEGNEDIQTFEGVTYVDNSEVKQQYFMSKEKSDYFCNSSNIDHTSSKISSGDEKINEVSPEVFVTPQTSSTIFKECSDRLDIQPLKNLRVSEILPVFNKNMQCQKSDIEDYAPTDHSEKSTDLQSDGAQENLTRMQKINASCKMNNYPNSLVCRERKNIVKAVLEKCEFLEQRAENVLKDGNKEENLKEIFIDLERMGNCILKTVSSKDELSNENSTMPKLSAQINTKRTFTTSNSDKTYTRFREWKPKETKENKKEKEDFEELDEIHDEALENEVFFGRDKKNNELKTKKGVKKNKTTRSIYHEIVRMSELNNFEVDKTRKKESIEKERNLLEEDLQQLNPNETKTTKVNDIVKSRNESTKEIKAPPQNSDQDSSLSNNESMLIKQNNSPFSDDATKIVNFEENIKKNEEFLGGYREAEAAEKIEEHSTENFERTGVEEDIPEKADKGDTSDIKINNMLSEGKKHRILEKYAMINQEPQSSIFKINNEIKFDREKKRMCHNQKVAPKVKKNISKSSLKVDKEIKEKPRMILRLSPSKELYTPPVHKESEVDLKRMLLENPKMLMQIASKILSKNQYLNFLLDLKSTKDLKDHWMNQIREGISLSKTFSDLTNMINFVRGKYTKKVKSDFSENNPTRNRSKTRKLSEKSTEDFERYGETRPTKTGSSGLLSTKSDIDLRENRTSLELETYNQRPMTGELNPNSKQKKMLKKDSRHERSSRRNLSFQHRVSCDHPEYGPLPYTLVKYLESPLQSNHSTEDDEKREDGVSALDCSDGLIREEMGNELSVEDGRMEGDFGINMRVKEKSIENQVQDVEKEDLNLRKSEKDFKNMKINENICHPSKIENKGDVEIKVAEKGEDGHTTISDEDVYDKKEQQTAIVLPGREPIKISLISDEISTSTASSMRYKSEKNALDNLSDVLSNCSGPVTSLCEKTSFKKRTARKPGSKRNHKGELLLKKTPSSTNSSLYAENVQRSPGTQTNGLNLKKFDNPLKKFVRNHEDTSKMTDQVSKMENIDILNNDENKIRVIRTKSLSEVLKEDPNLLKKFRQKTMVDINKEQTEDATKRFEYRFHDFRRKEDKSMEMKAKRQEEHKKDLLTKFKCLIQARKVASDRTRQNIRSNDNQQIQPKVFSKILDKINYFKELEDPPNVEKKPEAPLSQPNSVSQKEEILPPSPKHNCGNRRFLHTKRKRINEDELITWVQEHPADCMKKITTGNVENCKAEKQNVIHIPWSSTCEVDAKI